MSLIFWLAASLAVIFGALAWIAAGVGARLAYRIGAVALLLAGLGVGFVALSELLGRPKPASQVWLERRDASVRVLAVRLEQGVAIYLWVLLPDEQAPRAYALPWRPKTAERLEEAMEEADSGAERIMLGGDMSKWSLYNDGELPIEIVAPPIPPLKPRRGEALEVKPPGKGI